MMDNEGLTSNEKLLISCTKYQKMPQTKDNCFEYQITYIYVIMSKNKCVT